MVVFNNHKKQDNFYRRYNFCKTFSLIFFAFFIFICFGGVITAETYENVSDVYKEFQWETNNINLQVRSCNDSDCSGEEFTGPDGTSLSYYNYVNNYSEDEYLGDYSKLNVSSDRYFQYKAYLWRNNSLGQNFTPALYDVDIDLVNSEYWTIQNPEMTSSPLIMEEISCTTQVESDEIFNLTFNWFLNGDLFKQEVIESSGSTDVTSSISDGVTHEGEEWNCSVYASNGNDSTTTKSSEVTVTDTTLYSTVDQVYNNFRWDTQNTWLQVRSCYYPSCFGEEFTGPDGTSSTWFSNSSGSMFDSDNVQDNRYFQYRVNLFRNRSTGQKFTPLFYNTSLDYSSSESSGSKLLSIIYPKEVFVRNVSWFNVSIENSSIDDSCWYNVDKSENLTMSEDSEIYYNKNEESYSEGEHDVYFYCNDTQGNTASESSFFTIDTTNPLVSFNENSPE
ncbi:MAG: hypothetical protein ACOCP4_05410, partial [Candidatus Woesearchaeota archaeon]